MAEIGAADADLEAGKLPADSPATKVLISSAPNDTPSVVASSGTREFRVESLG
jgi:transcription elongation GreA/GreB family factor